MDEAERRRAAVDDFDRQVGLPHGAVDLGSGPDVPTQGIPPEPTEPHPTRIHGSDVIHPEPDRPQCGYTMDDVDGIHTFRLCLAPAGHDGDHVPSEPIRRGDPDVPPMPSTSSEPVQYPAVDPEGDASYWRAKAEAEADNARRWRDQAEKATAAGLALARDEYEPDREGMHPSVQLDTAGPGEQWAAVGMGLDYHRPQMQAADQLAEAAERFVVDMRAAWVKLASRSRPYETHAALLEAIAAYHKAKNRSS